MTTPTQCIAWLFGRGLSISCNLSWTVPPEWNALPCEVQIQKIKETLRSEMNSKNINCSTITNLLGILKQHTAIGWRNLFLTTNWDNLLQREILSLGLTTLPPWLSSSHVFHINGTIEDLSDNTHRSPFLLEQDPATQRCSTVEAKKAYEKIIWDRTFVVVGMSFECEMDKFLLSSLGRVQDDLPIGESEWFVINPDGKSLNKSCSHIQSALPHAKIHRLQFSFDQWLERKLQELQSHGVLSFESLD